MNIILIHGHGESPDCFEHLDNHLDAYTRIYLSYDSSNGFANNLAQMKASLADLEGDVFLLGHSLGGIYCLYLSACFGERVKGAVTLATPFGGCEWAGVMSLFSNKRVLRDVAPYSSPITTAKKIVFSHPWLAIITMAGKHPLMLRENDGYVSYDSMTSRRDVSYCEVAEDHYSVLVSEDVAEIVERFIKRACNTAQVV